MGSYIVPYLEPSRLSVTFYYDENVDTPPPFDVVLEQESVMIPGLTGTTHRMDTISSTRFQKIIPLRADVISSGGYINWRVVDSFGNLPGTFGGSAQVSASSSGYLPLRGPGEYTVKSFPKMNMIAIESGKFRVTDLDFINVQALSMAQAARKARRIAELSDLSGTLIIQRAGVESAARPSGRFRDAMTEIARVIEFAVEEVRNQQKFDISNVELVRYL
jgi:hypothetical protein